MLDLQPFEAAQHRRGNRRTKRVQRRGIVEAAVVVSGCDRVAQPAGDLVTRMKSSRKIPSGDRFFFCQRQRRRQNCRGRVDAPIACGALLWVGVVEIIGVHRSAVD